MSRTRENALNDAITSANPSAGFAPAQASAVANLPLPAVHKLIERRLIRPRRLRTGRSIQRMLSFGQVLYLRLEAEGVRLLPLAARRAIAKKIELSPEVDAVVLTEGSAVLIQVNSVRLELDLDLRKLERAENMIVSDPEIMRGTPVYRETRIPVELIADVLSQGAAPEEILDGYPSLNREKVELAPLYVQAFPRRGRPASRPWAKRNPIRATLHRRALAG